MEQLNEARAERLSRLRLVEKERDSLEGAKLEAEAFLLKERDIGRERNKLLQVMRQEALAGAGEIEGKEAALKERLAKEREKLSSAEAELKDMDG